MHEIPEIRVKINQFPLEIGAAVDICAATIRGFGMDFEVGQGQAKRGWCLGKDYKTLPIMHMQMK